MIEAKVIKPTIPTTPERVRRIEALMMEDIGDKLEEAFQDTVSTWDKKPYFFKKVEVEPDRIVVRVYTENEIYGFVSRGTKKHKIPRTANGQVLRFREGYIAKTFPGFIKASPGGPTGGYVYFTAKRKYIQHPGTKARNFPKAVKRATAQYVKDRFSKMGKRVKMELSK